jgi:hypothetical protein
MLFVTPGVYGKVTALPPLEAANQPLNVCPFLTGEDAGAATVPPEINDPDEIEFPPELLKSTAYVGRADHWA